jgi:hypothetical protein
MLTCPEDAVPMATDPRVPDDCSNLVPGSEADPAIPGLEVDAALVEVVPKREQLLKERPQGTRVVDGLEPVSLACRPDVVDEDLVLGWKSR